MNGLNQTTIVFIVLIIIFNLLVFLFPSARIASKCQALNDREVISLNCRAKLLWRKFLFIQYSPFVILFLLAIFGNRATGLIDALIFPFIFFGLVAMMVRKIFSKIKEITSEEIEIRKFQKDKSGISNEEKP